MEVDGVFQFFDHGQHLRAGFHEVVGVFKNLFEDLVLWALAGVDLFFQSRKKFVVNEGHQVARGDLRLLFAVSVNNISSPVTPAVALGQR